MSRILWINPPCFRRKENIWYTLNVTMPPLGICCCAAVIEAHGGFHQEVLDLQADEHSHEQVRTRLAEGRYDWICITSTTLQINGAMELAQLAKEVLPGCKVVLGGSHPTACPEECLEHPAVDYVVRGEGEFTILELVKGDPPANILGLNYKEEEKPRHNPERPLLQDLDQLPMPAYHLLPMSKYRPAPGSYKQLPAVSLIMSRGCLWSCTFCTKNLFGNRVRARSYRKIFEEMDLLIRQYGIREFLFYDDTFTHVREGVVELCNMLIRHHPHITWTCMSRVDLVDEELLRLMKRAGCHQICYGVESGDQQIIDNIKKGIKLDRVSYVVAMTKQIGIDVRMSFMLGNPGETAATIEKTINFAVQSEPHIAQFNITVPYPGTTLFRWAESNGYLLTRDWDEYDLGKPLMQLPTIDNETLLRHYKIAYRRFYWRPAFILRQLMRRQTKAELMAALAVLPRMARFMLRLPSRQPDITPASGR